MPQRAETESRKLLGKLRRVVNTSDAPNETGFRYMPETGEERYASFCGVPIQRLGEALGVLVVQSRSAREVTQDEVYALEVVAMVLAEMAELGAFVGEGAALAAPHQRAALFRGTIAQEGAAEGQVYLHEPRVVVTNPISDDPEAELARLRDAIEELRNTGAEMPDNPILVARNIGPGELLEYGKALKGIVLEEGSVGSHATIVARAWAIPLVINAKGVVTNALNGDPMLVDGDQGIVHLFWCVTKCQNAAHFRRSTRA